MRNLAATLSIIDREQPQLSPLLTVPRETHGGMDRPIIGPRQQAAFEHLVDWVALITNTEDEAEISTLTESNTSLAGNVTPPTAIEEYAPARPRPIRFGAQLQPWQPKDPFDPEIFNRASGYRPKRTEFKSRRDRPRMASNKRRLLRPGTSSRSRGLSCP